MNNPDHISQSLKTIFWVIILTFFDADPESGMEKIRIRDKHPGSATLDCTRVFEQISGGGVRNTFTGIKKIYLVLPSDDNISRHRSQAPCYT